ncbi:BACON domain-containing protein [uncultured Bacteroides sp.]|mgnify:CR=1 FL=1|uniref:BACON domain-containing protein n=1 Tax=uncultured Bacteroides sp. TaxID=162156 RepID=UPI002635B177|nr:BACON domain-containing protein [uncultured Bacteroides sp.]
MKVFYFIVFFTAFALCSCSEESSTADSEIVLADGASAVMQFKADEDGSSQFIKFIANDSWIASTEDSWVSLSSEQGNAGENVISISLEKNYTGVERKAQITIICGDDSITIIIEQKAETSYGVIVDASIIPGKWNVKSYASYDYDKNTKQESQDESIDYDSYVNRFEISSLGNNSFKVDIFLNDSGSWNKVNSFNFKLDGNVLVGVDYDRPISYLPGNFESLEALDYGTFSRTGILHVVDFNEGFDESIIGGILEMNSTSMKVELYGESEDNIYTEVFTCVK